MSRRRVVRVISLSLGVVMIATGITATSAVADPNYINLPAQQKEKSVPVFPVPGAAAAPPPANPLRQLPAPQWPVDATADVALTPAPAGRQANTDGELHKAGTLPVSVSLAAGEANARAAGTSSKVRVQTFDQKVAQAAAINGMVLAVADAGGASGAEVSVQLDYSGFATAFGGDYGSRLRLFELPECALVTPEKPQCRVGTPLRSDNRAVGSRLTAKVTLPGTQDKGSTKRVLAAQATPSGAGGSFEATKLSPTGKWSAGGSGGDFTYSVPLRVPPPSIGSAPTIGLGYSSGAVDGRTSATNNQASAVGDGWELGGLGYIERRYKACSEDLAPGQEKTGDLCWATDNAVLHLNGISSELVKDGDYWRPKQDDGSRIERLTGAENGDDDGEHWKVTSTNGTQYFLGLNRLPGWREGKPDTNSAFTVPVFGNNADEPCHKDKFTDSWCNQAYRWNLDYVVDPNGNATTYYYDVEENFYGREQKADKQTPYVADGWLRRIEYGLRADALYQPAPNRVWFDYVERCLPGDDFACKPEDLNKDTARSWPDVPFDEICKDGDKCENKYSPAFFSRKRLLKVLTQVRRDDVQGPAQWRDVDSWRLRHEFPDTGDGLSPALWLAGITHTGLAGDPVTLPEVLFYPLAKPNRVANDRGLPLITRNRIEKVRNETGGTTTIKYSDPECVDGVTMPSSPEHNTLLCYPMWWLPDHGYEAEQGWFHKYVVKAVIEDDNIRGQDRSAQKKTFYDYEGGAAWHFDEAEFTEMKKRTWSQWRGFGTVRTTSGEPGTPQSITVETFMRGMAGDRISDTETRPAKVKDSENVEIDDHESLAGFSRETLEYDGTKLVSASIKDPKVIGPTAEDGEDRAFMTNISATRGRTLLGDGTWRRTKITNQFDDYGNTNQVEDYGDVDKPGDEACATTTYAYNTDAWILTKPAHVRTVGLLCGAKNVTDKDVVSDAKSSYDYQASGTPPTKGNLTATERWTGSATGYKLTQSTVHDDLGRPTEVTNSKGEKVTTAYAPGPGFPLRTITKTNPLKHRSVTTLDPAWGEAISEIGAADERVDIDYDALGRTIRGWAPGRSKEHGESATSEFAYQYRVDGPTVVTAKALQQNGNYNTSYTLYDGLLRERQVQLSAVGGGRIINDWFYDSRGLQAKVYAAHYDEAAPSGELVGVTANDVPNQTITEYDARGRETLSTYLKLNVPQWSTKSVYGGDRVTVIPPEGGTTTTVISDVHGRITERRQHEGRDGNSPFDATRYTFDNRGLQDSLTGPDGAKWRYEYDQLGRQSAAHDPDRGTSTYTYDELDRLETSTDARGARVRTEYDELGRKKTEFERPASDKPEVKTASWTYDTLKKGQPDSSTRWVGDQAYVKKVDGYDDANRPTSSSVTVPGVEGNLAKTYAFQTRYDSKTGKVTSETQPAAGGLAAETINYRYNDLGLQTETWGIDDYVKEHLYTKYGDTLLQSWGTGSKKVTAQMSYEEGTRRLSTVDIQRNTVAGAVLAKRSYTYDAAGNVKRLADISDVQCFNYDYLRRMTSAFTPGDGKCEQEPKVGILGGSAPYYSEYKYDKGGNRTKEIQHRAEGDTVRDYSYGAPDGSQPHTLRTVTQTGPKGTSRDEYGYDKTGNMTSRNVGGSPQTLEWDPAGRNSKMTQHDGRKSEYIYDADGGRLVKRESGITTLYLGGMELILDNTTKAVTARRYYTHDGAAVAVRSTGRNAGLSWILDDHQGTSSTSVRADNLEVTNRQQDPFGNPRGEQPKSWPDDKGFVGGTKDESGLTNLGARQYDPATGRFVSVDPVMDTADPQQMNGYAYANNSPVTNSDPNGLYWKTYTVVHKQKVVTRIYGGGLFAAIKWIFTRIAWIITVFVYRLWIEPPPAFVAAMNKARALKESGLSEAEYEEAKKLADDKRSWVQVAIAEGGAVVADIVGVKGVVDNCINNFSALKCGWEIVTALPWGKVAKLGKVIDKLIDAFKTTINWITRRSKALADLVRFRDAEKRIEKACNSFVPGTLVLMADGTRRPIEHVALDDKVKAVNPETGEFSVRKVVRTIVGQGEKHLVAITVSGAQGEASGGELVATAGHPFWSSRLGGWVPASRLSPGDELQTDAGVSVRVVATRAWSSVQQVHNLTVDSDHTYHVIAGAFAVLVHNCDELADGYTSSPALKGDPYHPDSVAERSNANWELYGPTRRDLAAQLGFTQRIPPQRAHFNSHGQEVFTDGRRFITKDVDEHNTRGWKMFNRRGDRLGTYDMDLNRVGD
ncbi:RHS repeat-associated core domain-containing protein [Amycolatopsis sp. NPDC059657]|uniref:RHS repeat-associated core domain-containing protein n=1 Tax=Amycolatopsis sp. NPDC059657 TaxID=3346899 RepID=UPI00366AA600